MNAEVLRSRGIYRITTPLPFPQVNHVHAYFIDGEEPALIDTGLRTSRVWAEIERQFQELGLRLDSVGKILLTHGHIDHYGIARMIVERSGAKVFIHPLDAPKVLESGTALDFDLYRDYLRRCGLPEHLINILEQMNAAEQYYALKLDSVENLGDGDVISAGDLALRAFNMPGHTPGMICLLEEQGGILFSGDHVLPSISPNPLLELGQDEKFRSLIAYMQSFRKAVDLRPKLVLPAHGEPLTDINSLAASLFRFYDLRQKAILKILKGSARTPFAIMEKLFPHLSMQDVFLAISEVIGNLEVLEENGAVEQHGSNGVMYYSLRGREEGGAASRHT